MANDIKENFNSANRLYHFTRFETALKIIASDKLRFGKLSGMNDVCENSKLIYNRFCSDVQDCSTNDIFNEMSNYRQISMTYDTENKMGFDLQQMWGLYADKGKGVCLVYDKNEILKALQDGDRAGIVKYDIQVTPDTIVSIQTNDNLEDNVRANYKYLFFRKREEWEWEQEYRIVRRCADNKEAFLDVSGCLKFIIMQNAESQGNGENVMASVEYRVMASVVGKIPILQYAQFVDNPLLDYQAEINIWNGKTGFASEASIDDIE